MKIYCKFCLAISLGIFSGCTTSSDLTNSQGELKNTSLSAKNQIANQSEKRTALLSGTLSSPAGKGIISPAKNQALDAEYQALENGRPGTPVSWQHSSAQKGEVTPFQPYQVGSSNCRRYTHVFIIDGNRKPATATACRESNGVWVPLT